MFLLIPAYKKAYSYHGLPCAWVQIYHVEVLEELWEVYFGLWGV